MKKILMLLMALSLAAVLAACNNDDAADKKGNSDKQTEQEAPKEVKISDDEKVKDDKVVAKINDTDIKGEQYNESYAQTKAMLSLQFGQDVSDKKKVKDQTMSILIQQELLKQDAKKQGIE